jgi:hypothetical protein
MGKKEELGTVPIFIFMISNIKSQLPATKHSKVKGEIIIFNIKISLVVLHVHESKVNKSEDSTT